MPGAHHRGQDAAWPLGGSGLGVLAPDELPLGRLGSRLARNVIWHSWKVFQCSSGRLASKRSLDSAQQWEVKMRQRGFSWGSVPPWQTRSNSKSSEMGLMRKKRGSKKA